MSKFCPNCAKEVADSAKFCNRCGTALAASETAPFSAAYQPENAVIPTTPTADAGTKSRKLSPLQIILIILVIAAAVFDCLLLFTDLIVG